MNKPIKQKTCRICKKKFKPYLSTQNVCDWSCAIKLVNKDNDREYRKETVRLKKTLKTRSDWLREAQTAFNSYIRARDAGKPCCSCDKPDNGQHQRHASHYRSVKACSILRFNTWNVWASCSTCNAVLSGNLLEYRIRLTKAIGSDRVEWLECQNDTRRYEIDYLQRLKKIFNKRAKQLNNRYSCI